MFSGASLGPDKTRGSRPCSRGAEGAEGSGVWGGVVPIPTRGGVCEGGIAPSPENFSIFELKKASFGVSWVLFFAVD